MKRTPGGLWGYENRRRCPKCRTYGLNGYVCTCQHNSIDPATVERRRKRDARRGYFESELLRANRRIQAAAKQHGRALPFKLVAERSRVYRTIRNQFSDNPPRVDVVNLETGAVIAAAVDPVYWAGEGTKAPKSQTKSTRVEQWYDDRDRRERGEAISNTIVAPLVQWLLDGAQGRPPGTQ